MDNMLVVVFDSEDKADEGIKALQGLHDEGSINLYAKAVIARDANGVVTVKKEADKSPLGTVVGLLTGSLIGLIGGPVGLAVGAGAGSFAGMLYDMAHLGISQDFFDEVEQDLEPGKAAVVAEVWEERSLPVDTCMETLGGVVMRSPRREVLDTQGVADLTTYNAEVAELEAERDQATSEAQVKLQKKVDKTKGKLRAVQDDIQARIEASQQETEAKIKSLQEQADKDRSERKAKRERRIAELRAEQKRRNERLKEAWQRTKDALSAE
jgi:uncharacterized membrane protein